VGKLRVLITDDHPLMVKGIREALAAEPNIEIVGEASSGAQVLPLVARTSPDLVLLDLRLPELDGLEVLELVKQTYPDVRVAMLSVVSDPEKIAWRWSAGRARTSSRASTGPIWVPRSVRLCREPSSALAVPLSGSRRRS